MTLSFIFKMRSINLASVDFRNYRLEIVRKFGFDVLAGYGKFLLVRHGVAIGLFSYIGNAINRAERIFTPELSSSE